MSRLKLNLQNALNEKDVENAYRQEFGRLAPKGHKITSPMGSDGLLIFDEVRALLEFKHGRDLSTRLSQASVLIQCLYYAHKMQGSGKKLPNVFFVGDKEECFALSSGPVLKYMDEHGVDWSVAPSSAHIISSGLLDKMSADPEISPFIRTIDDNFSLREVLDEMPSLAKGLKRKIRITERNIEAVFQYFDTRVLGSDKALSANDRVSIFIQLLVNPSENYQHPRQRNILEARGFGQLRIDGRQFESFFSHFDIEKYSPSEKEYITSISDRLIEDVSRREKGEFYTPTHFVDLAHEYMSDVFGEDWKERYVVWDPAAGTGNLTRDYRFKELYVSTLLQSDIDTIEQMGYNPGATKFQFDFLNDGDEKLPPDLLAALRGERDKKVLIFMNPPYGTAGSSNFRDGHKTGIAKTRLRQEMEDDKAWGRSRQQLFAQFYYRIWKHYSGVEGIGAFTNPVWLSGSSHTRFREDLFSTYTYGAGFLLQASEFADVSDTWGVSFSVLREGGGGDSGKYPHNLAKTGLGAVEIIGRHSLYNSEMRGDVREWVGPSTPKGSLPKLSSALRVRETSAGYELPKKSIGLLVSDTNSVYTNHSSVFFLSAGTTTKLGKFAVTPKNIHKCIALFTARKTIQSNWINQKDEYLAPDEEHPKYEQFVNDSFVFSLFNNSSQQSSLRQIEYKDELWDIKNEFFWQDHKTMKALAEGHYFDELYQDARYGQERFIYKYLFDGDQRKVDQLSPLARKVLDAATQLLIIDCFKYREVMHEEHPEYHLNAWDAGYAQLKRVAQQFMPEEFKAFRELYREFEAYLRPQVYELGFLLGDGSEVELL